MGKKFFRDLQNGDMFEFFGEKYVKVPVFYDPDAEEEEELLVNAIHLPDGELRCFAARKEVIPY